MVCYPGAVSFEASGVDYVPDSDDENDAAVKPVPCILHFDSMGNGESKPFAFRAFITQNLT